MTHPKIRAIIIGALTFSSTLAVASISTEILGRDGRQCVEYARSRVPSLPYGLYSLNDKLRIINSHSCKKGSVAIIDAGSVGHVAVVEDCDNSGSTRGIIITETNYKGGYKTRRTSRVSGSITKAESELRIRGYYRP